MSRLPPTLSYLSIYNPTLVPSGLVDLDDEDAEEQAHILFYTSNERAVSRDKMLRQVGLAKALTNFSELFNPDDACDNVHSQSKRMVMLSPEQDFWIHAGIQLARTPRPTQEPKPKAKGKEKEAVETIGPVVYDYHDGSVHDLAMRAHLQRGYDQFKLTHGSFAHILSTLGQQALELQLERFFTVWAWSWSLEDRPDFASHIGTSLHPAHQTISPLLDAHSPTPMILLRPPHIVPSTRYTESKYPPCLASHLLSLVPPPQSMNKLRRQPSANETIRGKSTPPPPRRHAHSSSYPGTPGPLGGTLSFPAMPSMNPSKWGWTGYLTFGVGGKPAAKKPTAGSSLAEPPSAKTAETVSSPEVPPPPNTAEAEGAIESKDASTNVDEETKDVAVDSPVESTATTVDLTEPSVPSLPEPVPPPTPEPAPPPPAPLYHLSKTNIYLLDVKRKVYYITRNHAALAFVALDNEDEKEDADMDDIAGRAVGLLDQIERVVNEEETKRVLEAPSASKILQSQDTHLIYQSPFTVSSTPFKSSSENLYNAQALHHRDPTISEVFSRGQNPQHWHVLGTTANAEIYLEVERKEASLTDVDNVLGGVARRLGP